MDYKKLSKFIIEEAEKTAGYSNTLVTASLVSKMIYKHVNFYKSYMVNFEPGTEWGDSLDTEPRLGRLKARMDKFYDDGLRYHKTLQYIIKFKFALLSHLKKANKGKIPSLAKFMKKPEEEESEESPSLVVTDAEIIIRFLNFIKRE